MSFPVFFDFRDDFQFPVNANAIHRYRADLGVTGNPVTAWNDQIGTAHLEDGTGAPAFSAGAGPNGRDAITFDGVNDALFDLAPAINQPWHVFLVIKWVVWGSGDHFFGTGDTNAFIRGKSGGAEFNTAFRAGTNNVEVDMVDTAWHVLAAFGSGVSSYMTLDGTNTGTADAGPDPIADISLGARPDSSAPANCAIAEFIAYDAEITGAALTDLEAYFAERYGITFA